MIQAVRFRNFKALRDVEIALDRFTLLTGPNASGKTSVLDGLHLLTRLASTDPRLVFEGRSSLGLVASRGGEGTLELGLSGTFRRKRGELSIAFTAIEDFPFSDAYRFESRWGDRRFSVRGELNPPDDTAPETHPGGELGLGLVLGEAANVRFDLEHLAAPAYSDLATPIVSSTGLGLAAVVAEIAAARPDDFTRLQEALRAVVPGLLRLRLARVKVPRAEATGEATWGHEVVFDMAGASDIPARAASEGLLRALGLFATLLGDGRPNLVLVDRIEQAIHPSSYPELMAQLREILAFDPELQIVATSDSEAFLDEQAAETVRVHCLLEDGSVRVKPLLLHPERDLLREDMRPGAFLTRAGDAWVADEGGEGGETGETEDEEDEGLEEPPPSAPVAVAVPLALVAQAKDLSLPPPLPGEVAHASPPELPPDQVDDAAYPAGMPPLPHRT